MFTPSEIVERQIYLSETIRKICLMLDLADTDLVAGEAVPLGWHFPLLGALTARYDLRRDRFPGLGIPLPEIELPRVVAASRRVTFKRNLPLAQLLERRSSISSLVRKDTPNGKIAIMTADHSVGAVDDADAAIEEQQTYIFLAGRYAHRKPEPEVVKSDAQELGVLTPDDTLLFQFSALSFNSHRIHLDRDYARNVEGYPDLVVNGGLTTLLMTEFARTRFGFSKGQFKVSNKAPLFVDRPITFVAEQCGASQRIVALDDNGSTAAELEFTHDTV